MDARAFEVWDALAARINTWWTGKGADDAVLTPWVFRIEAAKHQGRKVYIFPQSYTNPAANRGEDQGDYSFVLVIVERCASAGDPPDAWTRERANWVATLNEYIGNVRGPNLLAAEGDPYTGLWPQSSEVSAVCDTEELTERKLFVSTIEITYREEK